MIPDPVHQSIIKAARMIKSARYVVAFTGAGISTPSGIPDFRTPGSGLWAFNDPMQVASLTAFRTHPERFFDWLRPLAAKSLSAKPNAAHQALSILEEAGILKAVITQNIDRLHQKSGSKKVYELHGSMETLSCGHCHKQQLLESVIDEFINQQIIPHCSKCGSILKPDIVLYEEPLPQKVWNSAETEVLKADLLLVVGSSLEVYPAASLPILAVQNGCKLILNNLDTTSMDGIADDLIHWNTAEALPALLEEINKLK